jgi:hypothetical protein
MVFLTNGGLFSRNLRGQPPANKQQHKTSGRSGTAMFKGRGGQTSMAAYVNATPGKLQEPFLAFRGVQKAPMDGIPTDPDTFLDADGAIINERLHNMNACRSIHKRHTDTVTLLRHGPGVIASLRDRTTDLVAQRNRFDAPQEFYGAKSGAITSMKVPSQTTSACGVRRSLRVRSGCRLGPRRSTRRPRS